jgi:hypothetical protein
MEAMTETSMSAPLTRREARAQRERTFRDDITQAFREGRLGIENGWLFEYINPGHSACTEYGCPPSCYTVPVMDLWAEHSR